MNPTLKRSYQLFKKTKQIFEKVFTRTGGCKTRHACLYPGKLQWAILI